MQIEQKHNRDRQGIGSQAASEENQEGGTVILVDRSTEGYDWLYCYDREGAEPRDPLNGRRNRV